MAFPLSRLHHRLAATAVLAALALPALAQPAPATPPAAGATAAEAGPRHHKGAKGNPAQRAEKRAQHRAERLATLKGKLQLTPAQEPAWTAFTTSMQPGERPARLDRQGMAQLTTPERIDRMRALRAQHAAEADRRGEATKAFYAALSPEQQKTFDAQAHRGGPRMHRHGDHGGGHPHGKRGAQG